MVLVGANGAIGTRYRFILNHLERPFVSFDVNYIKNELPFEHVITHKDLARYNQEAALICVPSQLHFKTLNKLRHLGYTRFFVEKPVFTEINHYEEASQWDVDIRAAMNYKFIDDPAASGRTIYSNFYAGKERTEWNLFQPVALARGEIELNLECPVWSLYLNGKKISLEQINLSYVQMIKTYLDNPHLCVSLEEAEGYFFKVKRWFSQNWQSEFKPDSHPKDSLTKLSVQYSTEKTF